MPHLNKPHPTYSPTQFHHGAIRKRAHNFRKRAHNFRQKASYSIDSIIESSAKEPITSAKEPYISAKKPYASAYPQKIPTYVRTSAANTLVPAILNRLHFWVIRVEGVQKFRRRASDVERSTGWRRVDTFWSFMYE